MLKVQRGRCHAVGDCGVHRELVARAVALRVALPVVGRVAFLREVIGWSVSDTRSTVVRRFGDAQHRLAGHGPSDTMETARGAAGPATMTKWHRSRVAMVGSET